MVQYQVSVVGSTLYSLSLSLRDQEGTVVATSDGPAGELKVLKPHLWWPYLMHENPGYCYSLEVMTTRLPSCVHSLRLSNRVKELPHGSSSLLIFSHGPCSRAQSGIATYGVIRSSFASFLDAEQKGLLERRGTCLECMCALREACP